MTPSIPKDSVGCLSFEDDLKTLRPKLHRYCARMAGSAVDGEDIVQEVLVKAFEALPEKSIDSLERWLFGVAHNAAVDFLRRRKRQESTWSEEDPDMIIDSTASATDQYVAASSLRTFMYLPVAQRGCTILMDVLGYSLQEVAFITGLTVPAVKAALHRGRTRIRELAEAPHDIALPTLSQLDLKRLANYVDRSNARDFDAIRDLLADDVRLELVARARMEGRPQVSKYFHNYAGVHDWRLAPGLVDGRPALLVLDPNHPAASPSYFVLLEWAHDHVATIRDFRYARYVTESAEIIVAGSPMGTC